MGKLTITEIEKLTKTDIEDMSEETIAFTSAVAMAMFMKKFMKTTKHYTADFRLFTITFN